MFCILVPAVITIWALSFPAVRILFERGAFLRDTTEYVAKLLHWYLPASLGLCLQAVLVRSFYAKEKMWTPTLINTGIFLLTIPAYLFFAEDFGIYVVPIIGASGAILQVATMVFLWARQTGTEGMEHALWNMGRALASFAAMIVIAIAIENISYDFVRSCSLFALIVYSGFIGILLFPTCLGLQKAIGSDDAGDILNELLGKILRKSRITKKKL